MNEFERTLILKIRKSRNNNFGIENYDEDRFGPYNKRALISKRSLKYPSGVFPKIKYIVKLLIKNQSITFEEKARNYLREYPVQFERLWESLNKSNKELLVSLIAYRIMGFQKIKLPRNNEAYWEAQETAKTLVDGKETVDPHFLHFMLSKLNLKKIGFDIQLYFTQSGVATDFIIEQYAYKENDKYIVFAEPGEVVLDLGACWGDTALYFADKVGENGKVFSFEFIPGNIKLFKMNVALNPHLESRINLISNPVSNTSDETIYFKDNGPASKLSNKPFEQQTGITKTINIDDFVNRNNLEKVDFIKMDIEGAETSALEGALETIKKFRPKLAIAIYHSKRDLVLIPNWILELNLDYEIFIGHYTIHSEETICFAKPINKIE